MKFDEYNTPCYFNDYERRYCQMGSQELLDETNKVEFKLKSKEHLEKESSLKQTMCFVLCLREMFFNQKRSLLIVIQDCWIKVFQDWTKMSAVLASMNSGQAAFF